ncbi:carbohydrate ABC transporter permease [Oceaniglobus trochenteri]|uniref:carbohydrate ABC transporter permease n=1 Tax=Oceaniglobus trochenteri TaxID=2763260 RepID=UPI001D001280|nr:carbohydrate ABC transporter permease [Oceaniglobus trochenteri]
MTGRITLPAILINAALILFALTTIFPMIWVIYNSLKSTAAFSESIFALPSDPTFRAYVQIFEVGTVWTAMWNSLFYAVASTTLIVLLSYCIAYVLARFEFPGRAAVFSFFILGLLLPIPALLVPVFMQYRTIGILDTQFTLLIPYTAFGLSLAVFLMEGYIRKIPVELDEAAHVDGASLFTVMFVIVFPICRPIVATVALLSFLHSWNEFAFATTLIRDESYKPIPLWLRTFGGQYATDYPALMAGMVLASVPIIVLFIFFREKIVEGFAGGAVKA